MINIRDYQKEIPGFSGFVARYDFLYDQTDKPDYYCSSIQDFIDNQEHIRDNRQVELPRVKYYPQGNGYDFEIKDLSGSLSTRLFVDKNKLSGILESWFQKFCCGDITRNKLRELSKGSFMYKVSLEKSKGGVYVLDFEFDSPFPTQKTESDYLALRFPKLAPNLVRSL